MIKIKKDDFEQMKQRLNLLHQANTQMISESNYVDNTRMQPMRRSSQNPILPVIREEKSRQIKDMKNAISYSLSNLKCQHSEEKFKTVPVMNEKIETHSFMSRQDKNLALKEIF